MIATDMTIILDTTLDDLYSLDSDEPHGVVTAYPHPSQPSRAMPHPFSSEHFLYGITFPNTTAPNAMQNILERGIAQRYSFIAGRAPVILFDSLPATTDAESQKKPEQPPSPAIADVVTLHAQLHPTQRPKLQFPRNASAIDLPPNTQIAIIVPQDELAHLPHILPPETHYHLLSKRWLALSSLPTPNSLIIDPIIPPTADHPAAIEAEISRMLHSIQSYPSLPFVIKVSVAASGRGTLLVRSETDRSDAYIRLRAILHTSFPHVTPQNAHLHPLALILQPFVAGEAHGISFFLTQTGRVIFHTASRQQFNAQGQWCGGWVSFPAQQRLKERYWGVVVALAENLHAEGYYGPVGADVMTEENGGRHVIVDVNPRVTGSYHLGLLRGHFVGRGLVEVAVLSPLYVIGDRSGWVERFAREIEEGRMIVTAWVQGVDGGRSYVAVTVGGEDERRLKRLVGEVEAFVWEGYSGVGE
ncbi:hypothetical protein ASPACDRAFT_56343 [Aspergillus aculeatus ATCC 16872]|uniref:ATP-grasp domain-containing protein n=1 Tax=Aspergillus aculeatus (strain ATCC 16872 / CBS 172.66 / WB 5094) TaxID=690307 RepID=A0A1L9X937_ASPA1|nr:uncharacterized protein ASPACDRAFT_56343 [Aspergillus aculeatus ATCC 16872]OJK04930.1 hypothetical protein ASPACDRAFT_56343 [Aspergillus aculeatus ATCC 16872]